MVVIRLSRHGAKKKPFYHVVVMNKKEARDGRFIEKLGYYNPIAQGKETELELNLERIDYWVSKGAQLSERVAQLLKDYKAGRLDAKAEKKAKKIEAKKAKKQQESKAATQAKAEAAREETEAAAKEKAETEKVVAKKEETEPAEAEKVEVEKKEAEAAETKNAEKPAADSEKSE